MASVISKLVSYSESKTLDDAWRSTFDSCERTLKKEEVSWIVWLFENPKSPIALRGTASLYTHDHMHLLLNRSVEKEDEAFVIGYCMGNYEKTKSLDVWLFKFISKYLYPGSYRFDNKYLEIYDLGFDYGRSREFKNIISVDFCLIDPYLDISSLKKTFDIYDNDLEKFNEKIESLKR